MAFRVGYTANLTEAQFQLERRFKNTRNWKSTHAFKSKKEAKSWETDAAKEMKCDILGPIVGPHRPGDPWFGFVFEHDGPK